MMTLQELDEAHVLSARLMCLIDSAQALKQMATKTNGRVDMARIPVYIGLKEMAGFQAELSAAAIEAELTRQLVEVNKRLLELGVDVGNRKPVKPAKPAKDDKPQGYLIEER